jgi:hypothetical protein
MFVVQRNSDRAAFCETDWFPLILCGILRDVVRICTARVADLEHEARENKGEIATLKLHVADLKTQAVAKDQKISELEATLETLQADFAVERVDHSTFRRQVRVERAEKFDSPPSYWSAAFRSQHTVSAVGGGGGGGGGAAAAAVNEHLDVPELVIPFQKLVSNTFLADRIIRNRRGGPMPAGLSVVEVLQNQNSTLWQQFAAKRGEIYRERYRQNKLKEVGVPGPGGPCTRTEGVGLVPRYLQSTVSTETNEFYLFHGTSPDRALRIFDSGFRIDMAGAMSGTLFGKGAYFAECSSKSDEYAAEGIGLMGKGKHALLLCRVVCGNMRYVTTTDPHAHMSTTAPEHHSLIGDREASQARAYREFIVYDTAQVYPEFAIIYKRDTR